MGFKTDTSFLENLTMGAAATLAAMAHLSALGFSPLVLERYSTSNKLWSTKVKRLRLADLLCARTGIRIEVRAKAKLQIKMSDSPSNPERRWDAGLRDADLVALVPWNKHEEVALRADPVYFLVGDLRASAHLAKLGPRKSASEGAEQDRTWRSTVAKEDGLVVAVDAERITVRKDSGRIQHYQLKGKIPYVQPGDRCTAGAAFLAGDVRRTVNPSDFLERAWSPIDALLGESPSDRLGCCESDQKGTFTTLR